MWIIIGNQNVLYKGGFAAPRMPLMAGEDVDTTTPSMPQSRAYTAEGCIDKKNVCFEWRERKH